LKIYIPSLSRPNDQITLEHLPPKYQTRIILVVQQNQFNSYKILYKNKVHRIMMTENDIGIAKTRELICRDAGDTRFSMIDDDVVFSRRNQKYFKDFDNKPNMDVSKRLSDEVDLDEMYFTFNKWMDEGIIHIGNRRTPLPPMSKSFSDNIFFNSIHHFNGELLSEIIDEINWTRCKVGEDANLMFEYLTRGYSNRRSDEFIAEWGSYQNGGCDDYRNSKLHNEEHKKLQDYWGKEFVILRKKMIAQGKYGNKIGMIDEYTYKPKLAFKKSQT